MLSPWLKGHLVEVGGVVGGEGEEWRGVLAVPGVWKGCLAILVCFSGNVLV